MKNSVKNLDPSLIEEFSNQLRGEIVLPSDNAYNETRKVYNGMINKHPECLLCV